MPTFPRDLVDSDGDLIRPMTVPWPFSGGGYVDRGSTGRIQSRGDASAGFTWSERYGALPLCKSVRQLLAQVRRWATPPFTSIDIDHPRISLLGAGGGTPVVSGADQAGSSLVTSGWPADTEVLYPGDFIRPSSLRRAFEVTNDDGSPVVSDGAGNATIPISPSIFVGGSPPDADPILLADAGVPFFKVFITEWQEPTYTRSSSDGLYYVGLRITFEEDV